MTFQVVMMARDGWVLASDTRQVEFYPEGGMYTSSTTKLVYREDLSVAYGFAGDNLARQAGEILENELRLSGFVPMMFRYGALVKVGQETLSKLNELPKDARGRLGATRRLLIVFTAAPVQAWTLDIANNGDIAASQILDHGYGGQRPAALLFPQLFYRIDKNVRELKLLAAHTILTGARCNPTVIGGLEMIVCENGQIGRLPVDEIAALTAESERILSNTARQLARQPTI